VQGFARNVTERIRAEDALRDSEERYRTLFEESRDAVYMSTIDGGMLSANQALLEMFGVEPADLPSLRLGDLYHDPSDRQRFRDEIFRTGYVRDYEVRLKRRDGTPVHCLISSTLRRAPDGEVIGFQGIIHDITQRKHAEEQLAYGALHDALTGLPNRALFVDRLSQALERVRRGGGPFAVFFLDVDRFKVVNDRLGHLAADGVLVALARRLEGCVRAGDSVARLGGDEFALVLRTPIDERGALKVGETALRTMARPFVTEELSVHVAASIGIALFPDHGTDAEELMRRADVAMYRAKTLHSGCELYAPDWDADARYRRTLVTDLGHAIRGGNIRVHFQPIAEAASRRVTGVEALARWSHPEHGSIPPGEFVPIAEEASLARDLTRHVLAQALDQCRRWRDGSIDVSVRVNLTATDLHDASLPQEVAAALAARALPPEALVLEVTENSVLTDPLRIGKVLARLRELGVGLALDDFGTGYSSLTHLKTLPVGEVKIDRSFVADMATDAIDGAIVGSTIDLAHSLGMRVVAEGVEDERTWERLAELGCDLVQGYALSRPVPATELEAVLRDACPLAAGAA
jgi:diguanylate cyclase (GGDEF)-like protein/PAS domain S-box-containing protein